MGRALCAFPRKHAVVCDIDTHDSGSFSLRSPAILFCVVFKWNWPTRLEETTTRSLSMPP
jgi:hypothetical protein